MRLDHLLSKEFLFWNGKEDRLEDSFKDFWLCLFWQRGTGFFKGLACCRGSGAALRTCPHHDRLIIVCGCLFGVGVLVVNCIVDASIFDLCKQY